MFQLHERLAADTHKLGESRLCDVLLMNDSTWPWIILVPRVSGIREIYQLASEQQQQLLAESSMLSEGMMELFAGDKMNVAALGNMVPQDRKSTRLNSSHVKISYAVFCLKKKKKKSTARHYRAN